MVSAQQVLAISSSTRRSKRWDSAQKSSKREELAAIKTTVLRKQSKQRCSEVILPCLSWCSRQLCKVLRDTWDLGSQTHSVSEALLLTSTLLPDKRLQNFQSLVSYLAAAYVSSVTQQTTVLFRTVKRSPAARMARMRSRRPC